MSKLTDDERTFIRQVREDRTRSSDDQMSSRDIAVFLVIARRLKVLASELEGECNEVEREVKGILSARV
jgi:hypothetical protein